MVSLKHTVQATETSSSIPEQQASGNTVIAPDGEGEGEGEEKEEGEEGSF